MLLHFVAKFKNFGTDPDPYPEICTTGYRSGYGSYFTLQLFLRRKKVSLIFALPPVDTFTTVCKYRKLLKRRNTVEIQFFLLFFWLHIRGSQSVQIKTGSE
jgi:hypothetical protein